MLKRILGLIFVFSMLLNTHFVLASENELEVKLKINTEWQNSENLILHIIKRADYQILAPARTFFAELGAEIEWVEENKSIVFTKGNYSGVLTIDSDIAVQNGTEVKIPVAPRLVDGVSYVPVEFCGKTLNFNVLREQYGRTVRIYSKTNEFSTKFDGTIKPGMAELTSTVHRPVPTEFEKSNQLDDLIFYGDYKYTPREQLVADKVEALDPAKIPQGEVIYTMEDIFESTPDGSRGEGWWKQVEIDEEGVPFDKVLRINCSYKPQNRVDYIVKPSKLIENEIDPEDKYLVKFYVRLVNGGNIDTGIGFLYTHIECDVGWEKGFEANTDVEEEWKVVYGVLTGVKNSNHIGFTPGEYLQTIDIGGFEVQKLPKDADVSMLIQKSQDIDYMTSDLSREAPWRKEALERIEQVRKGDFKVVVLDKEGNPVPNADVKFDMFEHEFKIGIVLAAEAYDGGVGLSDKAMKVIAPVFNSAGCGNEQKLSYFDANRFTSRRILDDAKNMGLKYFRGHAIWMPLLDRGINAPYRFYGDGKVEEIDYETFLTYVKEHINKIVYTMPEIYEWDITNEMTQRVTFDKFDKVKYMADIYRYCDEVFPEGMDLAVCGNETGKAMYWDIFDQFQKEEVPYDVCALQNHCGVTAKVGITDMLAIYDRFVYEYGKQFTLTEFSMHYTYTPAEYERAGDMVRDFVIAVFSHPGANAFNCFWLSDDWSMETNCAALFGENFEPKPAYYQWCDLFYNKFWTRDAHTITDENGKGMVRGFYGDYDITVSIDGKEVQTTMAAFHKGYENELTIVLQ